MNSYLREILLLQNNPCLYKNGDKLVDETGIDSLGEDLSNDLFWCNVDPLTLGKCGELYAQYVFSLLNLETYTAVIDNHGIDLIFKKDEACYKVQVKTVRNDNYTFIKDGNPESFGNFLIFYVRVSDEGLPQGFLFPMSFIKKNLDKTSEKNGVKHFLNFTYHKYTDCTSPAEYGISSSKSYYQEKDKNKTYSCVETTLFYSLSIGKNLMKNNIDDILKLSMNDSAIQ